MLFINMQSNCNIYWHFTEVFVIDSTIPSNTIETIQSDILSIKTIYLLLCFFLIWCCFILKFLIYKRYVSILVKCDIKNWDVFLIYLYIYQIILRSFLLHKLFIRSQAQKLYDSKKSWQALLKQWPLAQKCGWAL